jgi:L-ascorbate metabolism protein UlaG (beta-lactamase superfamily)
MAGISQAEMRLKLPASGKPDKLPHQRCPMQIQRLFWAGIKVEVGDTRLVVDLLEDVGRLRPIMGEPKGPLFAVATEQAVDLAVITHLHPDHYDPRALQKRLAPSGKVVCHRDICDKISADGFPCHALGLEEPFVHNDVTLTAVPAVDGFGDPQVSWVIQGGGKKIIHCGDTLWHGHWWRIRRKHGPFDAAFLCINGVVMTFPGLEPSGIPADMTAAQAAAAGKLLDARFVCPIHYGTFNAPQYSESPNAEQSFLFAARERGVAVQLVAPGDFVNWDVRKAEVA